MTTKIITLALPPGKLEVYGDEDGCWLELHSGDVGVEVPVTLADLDRLRDAIILNEKSILKAQVESVDG